MAACACAGSSCVSSWAAPPKGATILVATCLTREPALINDYYAAAVSADLLGIESSSALVKLVTDLPQTGDVSAQVITLAVVLGALKSRRLKLGRSEKHASSRAPQGYPPERLLPAHAPLQRHGGVDQRRRGEHRLGHPASDWMPGRQIAKPLIEFLSATIGARNGLPTPPWTSANAAY